MDRGEGQNIFFPLSRTSISFRKTTTPPPSLPCSKECAMLVGNFVDGKGGEASDKFIYSHAACICSATLFSGGMAVWLIQLLSVTSKLALISLTSEG